MIEALSLPEHRCARYLFNVLNVLGILAWLVGAATTAKYFHEAQDSALASAAMSDATQRTTAALMLAGYVVVGLLLILAAQVLRYLAAIAEATGRRLVSEE